jgi:Lon protease-like protein
MSPFEQTRTEPVNFPQAIGLFPLPNMVLFPNVVQPLHVFEARYIELIESALATHGLISMVLLQPGWEHDYDGRPQVSPVACVGQIISHQRLADGRYNLLLQGLRRAAIQRELPTKGLFRQVEVDLLDDFYPPSGKAGRAKTQRRLIEFARHVLPDGVPIREELDQLLASQVSLGMLTDIFAHTLGIPLSVKQRLLAQWNVDRRAALLIDRLTALAEATLAPTANPSFPPPFSLN